MLNIFIGYDSREPIAYHVLAHSIMRRASLPVSITPLILDQLRGRGSVFQTNGTESTEFAFSRFLVPHLARGCDWQPIFMDCDMLCLADIAELFESVEPSKLVSVCQHDYIPKAKTKFLGQAQTAYPRKNWSSLMVFNSMAQYTLTAHYVQAASGLDLHRLKWAKDEEIGSLPLEWNWLVGEYPPNPNAKILHYTNGGPWFERTEYADLWMAEYRHMISPMESQDKRYLVGAS